MKSLNVEAKYESNTASCYDLALNCIVNVEKFNGITEIFGTIF